MALSAPSLLLDLLGTHGGEVSVGGLCRAGGVFGVGETTVRVTLTRLVAEGKIRRVRRGVYAPPSDPSALSRRVAAWRWHGEDTVAWSGDWVAVHDGDVQRSDKVGWRTHQRALSLSGFRSLGQGLEVRPNNRPGGAAEAAAALRGLGLSDRAMVFRAGAFDGATQRRAAALWDVPGMIRGLEERSAELRQSADGLSALGRDDAVRQTLLLGRDTITLILRDPVLPEQLMPSAARTRLIAEMSRYQALAYPLWQAWLAD
ncbi:type IV toxin-antitoxin system AbiEi family antitoxin domain-containing protein [Leucobacter sp. G161]|uniref:type IV toxin-antitoxin system AbiEi family antitoxin domain-containing protein n=1 Tax=Leucobacter sp. G161 TaxID=663704 RepID=UPI00073BDFDD|nr:type IV toxin-antitoxin system AbiEi family antitoxin domain-containing protein [Leucobacter sp. G161]KUF07117.1 hypothetical protein AUL38_02130 [Leucobacter sp. G161]